MSDQLPAPEPRKVYEFVCPVCGPYAKAIGPLRPGNEWAEWYWCEKGHDRKAAEIRDTGKLSQSPFDAVLIVAEGERA